MRQPWPLLVLVIVVGGVGGAAPALAANVNDPLPFVADVAALRVPSSPDDWAIELLREERIVYEPPWSAPTYTVHTHRVIQVLSEGGFDAGTIQVAFDDEASLVYLDARTLSPAGVVVPVELAQVQADDASFKSGIEDDDDDGKRQGVSTRHFQFPRLEVGSVVEYRYAVRRKRIAWMPSEVMADAYPIKTYRLDIVAPKALRFDMMVGNRAAQLRSREDVQGVHAELELHDLPPLPREPHPPSAWDHLPWWAYRVIDIKVGVGGLTQGMSTWNGAAGWILRRFLLDSDADDGVPPMQHVCQADNISCLASTAVRRGRELAAFDGFAWPSDARSLRAVVRGHQANNSEKARLLYVLLKQQGAPVHLGVMARAHTARIDKTFPTSAQLNHMVLAIDRPAPARPLWIDPSCEHCEPGTLPSYSLNQEVLLIDVRGFGNARETVAEWTTTSGTLATEGAHTSVHDVTIAADGDVHVHRVSRCSGEDALQTFRGSSLSQSARSRRENARRQWRQVSPAATVTSVEPWSCDRSLGTCSTTEDVELPGLAAVTSTRLLLPLSFMENWNDRLLADWPVRPRTSDWVIVDGADVVVDIARITAPPGHVHANLPAAVAATGPNTSVTMSSALSADRRLLTITRTLRHAGGRVPRARVDELKAVLVKHHQLLNVVVELAHDGGPGDGAASEAPATPEPAP